MLTRASRKDLLADPSLAAVLGWFARLVRMQICDVEWRHHRNRAASNISGSTRWANFVANFINGEAKCSQEARAQAREEMRAAACAEAVEPAAAAPAAPADDAGPPLRTRAARPLDVFREEHKRASRGVRTFLASGFESVLASTPSTPPLNLSFGVLPGVCPIFEAVALVSPLGCAL